MILHFEDAPGWKTSTLYHDVLPNGKVRNMGPRYPVEAYGVAYGDPVELDGIPHQTLHFQILFVHHEFQAGTYDALLTGVQPGIDPIFAEVTQAAQQHVRVIWPGLPVSPDGKSYAPLFFELEN